MSSRRHTHWCYRCRATVRLRGNYIMCSNCAGGFLQELDQMEEINTIEFFRSNSNDPRFEAMEALSGLARRRFVRRNLEFRGVSEGIPENAPTFGSSLSFPDQIPMRRSGNGGVELVLNGNESNAGNGANVDHLSMSGELNALIEQVTMDDNERLTPASNSSINAMPTLIITQAHLQEDLQCPICIENFKLGTEARQMPCNHMYHMECIVPWLVRHNSCPICRYQLPQDQSSSARGNQGSAGGSRTARTRVDPNGRYSRRNNIFRSARANVDIGIDTVGIRNSLATGNTSRSHSSRANLITGESSNNPATISTSLDEQGRRNGVTGSWNYSSTIHEENHEMSYSGWPFDY